MFINFKILNKFQEQFSFSDLFYLCAVKQQDEESMKDYISLEKYQQLLEQGYIKTLKNGEVRLDKKGTELLKNISKSDEITKDTEKLCEWLVKVYKNKKGGIIRSVPNLKKRCQLFCNHTGFFGNKVATLIYCFINDCYDESLGVSLKEFMETNPRGQISNIPENMFWKPSTIYSTHFNLDDSPLWQYYLNNEEYIKNEWAKRNIEE